MTSDKQKVNILVVGPNNSGKTTFLETLSMTPLVEIDYRSSGEIIESNRPDCVEYGAFLTQDVEVELRSLTCRNADDFNMDDINWAVAEEGVDGVIMMVPADDPQAFLRAHKMFDHVQQRTDVPFLLALTRNDEGLVWDKAEVSDCFHMPQDFITYLDPRNYNNAFDTLNFLFEYVPLPVRQEEPALAMQIA